MTLLGSIHGVCRWVDRHALVLVVLLTTWRAMLLAVFARAKPFWHDEVYTILTAQRDRGSCIWRIPRPSCERWARTRLIAAIWRSSGAVIYEVSLPGR